jgi:hypothetical protein
MLASSSVARIAKFAVPLFVALWLLWSFVSVESAYDGVVRTFGDERQVFLSDVLEHEVDGDFDGHGIEDLCSKRHWTPELVLSCEPVHGGIGQVKNGILNCIRFAMEMGGEFSPARCLS